MALSRRGFLKVAGLALLGLVPKPAADILLRAEKARASPAAAPAAKRLVMVVDLKACTANEGCRKCIDECHRLHNVPEFDNAKDEIKWVWTASHESAFHQHGFSENDLTQKPVLVLCNHCDNPPCTRVCPTGATWKRDDGVVMMDYHRCIGCRYCMAACPYGSRSFNWRDPRPHVRETNLEFPTRTRGVVEKCNLCEERLEKGLVPGCVEVCPEKAMVFGDLEDRSSPVREVLRSRYAIQRRPELGTKPEVYYLV